MSDLLIHLFIQLLSELNRVKLDLIEALHGQVATFEMDTEVNAATEWQLIYK
jgi:hypothetical protein